MKLTLAGPGSGKTTDLVNQIKSAVSHLKQNKEMAVITYTNASVDDIKEKLSDSIVITPNIFIGTIHSFLMHYFIMPHADSLGYNTESVLVVDKLSEECVEWVDAWVDKKRSEKGRDERKQIKFRIRQKIYNSAIETAAKKGIYTYDGIIKIANQLSKKSEIMKSISNRVQYLFIDEYQDISIYGHNIVMLLEKRKTTEISVVGDPDQSIYRFRYGQSQIGERAPAKNKQPIRQLESLELCEKRKLLVNHRSSKEIVEFINRYCTLDKQESEKGKFCKIQFINSCKEGEIKDKFIGLKERYNCKSGMIIAKKGATLQEFNKSEIQDLLSNIERIDLKKLSDFIISSTALSHKDFMEQYSLTPYMLSRICVFIRNKMEKEKLTDEIVLKLAKKGFMELYRKQIVFKNSITDIDGKTQEFNFASKFTESYKKDECLMKYMTIHKAKGLEADCVLVIAENEKQLFKWLNMTKTDMRNESDEDYRLGYVAFSRARKVLAVAVLEEIDTSAFNTKIWDIV